MTAGDCPERNEHELARLSDDELIAHIRCSAAQGRDAESRLALQLLIWGRRDFVRWSVMKKVAPHHVEDVTDAIILDACEATFRGGSGGEFTNWLKRITQFAIADHFRRGEGKGGPTVPLADEGDEPGVMLVAEDELDAVENRWAIDVALGELSDDHRLVIERYVFEDQTAAEVAAGIAGMTEANVFQIKRRFVIRLREILEHGR